MKKLLYVIVLAFLSCSVMAISWTGAVDNDWNTAGNWDTLAVPTSADNVSIDTGHAILAAGETGDCKVPKIGDASNGELTINSGATLTAAAWGGAGNAAGVTGTVNVNGGTLNIGPTGNKPFNVGINGIGYLNVDGGDVYLNTLAMAKNSGSDGYVTLTNNGAIHITAWYIAIGQGCGGATEHAGMIDIYNGSYIEMPDTDGSRKAITDAYIANGTIIADGGAGTALAVWDGETTTVIPEPATLMLLGIGAGVLRRRRK